MLIFIRVILTGLIVALAGMSGCAHAPAPTTSNVLNNTTIPGFDYAITVPPRKTVEIVLPAVCLDYSKKTPDTSASFISRPVKSSPVVRRLFALHEHIVLEQETYRRHMQRIPSLKFLAVDEHGITTPGGDDEKVQLPLKYALDEALQHAIWINDPGYSSDQEKTKILLKEAMDKADLIIKNLKAGGNGEGLLDIQEQEMIGMLRRNGQWETVKADIFKELELNLEKAKLELEWYKAVESLARVMREAIERDITLSQYTKSEH